ncbi:MAG: hypothetical protein H0W12_11455 [Chitinophagaceae bacterium]|nr:hypothetical protein [Chitinophagaceae bacterium]
MKYIFLLFFIVVTAQAASAQDSAFRFLNTIQYPVASFTVNDLGELYIINTNNQLQKFNEKGDSVGVFNQVTKYGKLSYVDAQNPWKTILFYENFSTIVLLDKYLNVLTAINLRKQNIFHVKAVTTSYDSNIWVFDEQDNRLKKIDDAGNLLLQTEDFRLLFDSVPSPVQLIDRDGFVYLYDPQKGLYVFDYYGSFKNKIPLLHWKDIFVIGKKIYGFNATDFYVYTIGSMNEKQSALPAPFINNASIKIANHKIYLLKDNNIRIFTAE